MERQGKVVEVVYIVFQIHIITARRTFSIQVSKSKPVQDICLNPSKSDPSRIDNVRKSKPHFGSNSPNEINLI